MPDEPDELDKLRRGLGRTFATARLTARLGRKAAGRMLFKGKAPPVNGHADAELADAIAQARSLVVTMGGLKGLAMKAGQIASYMPGALPRQAQEILAELQAESIAMTFERIDEVIRAELGGGVDTLFDRFERTPFAAASIGQVHRAELDGRALAIKVQYPGIEDLIRSDLRTVGMLVRLSMLGSPVDAPALVGELRARLLEECDYHGEADNQALFARLFADIPGASAPAVERRRSARRVLATELSSRDRFAAFVQTAPQAVKDRAGQIIFRACFDLLFRRCIFNADPHPGNYLFAPDGDVTFLDFGCVRRFDPKMIETWKALARGILAGQRSALVDGFTALGFVAKPKKFDWDYQWEAMRTMYRPYLDPGFRYTDEFVSGSYGIMMFDNPNKFRIAMPPEWLFLNRLQWGLNAVLAQLHAGGPWPSLIHDALALPIEPA